MSNPSDAFTRLGHAALDARHNTTPENAQAALDVLRERVPPLLPYIEAMIRTGFVEVPKVAISQEGKIAYTGVTSDELQVIVECDSALPVTCNELCETMSTAPIHLHYTAESDDLVYILPSVRGRTTVLWASWEFEAPEDLQVDAVYGFFGLHQDENLQQCVVVSKHGDSQYAFRYIRGEYQPGTSEHNYWELACGDTVDFLGVFGEKIAILVTQNDRESVRLIGKPGEEVWQSESYDRVLLDSVMERDGQFSFVARCVRDHKEQYVLVGVSGETHLARRTQAHYEVKCLPSGKILDVVRVYNQRSDSTLLSLGPIGKGDPRAHLHSAVHVNQIVEIPVGLVVLMEMSGSERCLSIICEDLDKVWILNIITDGNPYDLVRWGDYLVFPVSKGDFNRLCVIRIADLVADALTYAGPITTYPLYCDFNRLVPTKEGILGWHFDNGTFTIIRYPLP